ncbi:hypothetical protein BH20ACI2_BH20ACI2_02930 [soil metagenome]
MKKILENLALFMVLVIAFSALTGCSDSSNTNVTSTPANVNTKSAGSKSSEYPPLAASIAQADFELLDGTKFKLTDHKGKILLVNIWGTWCGPCRAEMPHLVEMQDKHGENGFEVIGLNIGDGEGGIEPNELIEPFVEKMKLNYTIARSPNESTVKFFQMTKMDGVPQTLLIDREGRLRNIFHGGGNSVIESMHQMVDKIMAE